MATYKPARPFVHALLVTAAGKNDEDMALASHFEREIATLASSDPAPDARG
jgi:hypothetical protein